MEEAEAEHSNRGACDGDECAVREVTVLENARAFTSSLCPDTLKHCMEWEGYISIDQMVNTIYQRRKVCILN